MSDVPTTFREDQREGIANALMGDGESLQSQEREFYKKYPPSTLRLVPLEEETQYGMPIYLDQHGNRHSESTVTFPIVIGGREKWITVPSIWPGKDRPIASKGLTGRYWDEEQLVPFVKENISGDQRSFINPITQEPMPVFDTKEAAEKFAVKRDMSLQ